LLTLKAPYPSCQYRSHKTVPALRDLYWQEGYGAFSVSKSNVASVVKYIERQETHHRRRTFQQEFVRFLERHDVEYDPEGLWE
jgi:putative transposase